MRTKPRVFSSAQLISFSCVVQSLLFLSDSISRTEEVGRSWVILVAKSMGV